MLTAKLSYINIKDAFKAYKIKKMTHLSRTLRTDSFAIPDKLSGIFYYFGQKCIIKWRNNGVIKRPEQYNKAYKSVIIMP